MNQPWSLAFRYFMGTLLLIALVGFAVYSTEAIKALVIAGFIAYLVNPAVVLLAKQTRFKRRTSVNLVYFTAIALLAAIPATITPLFYNEMKGVAQDLLVLLEQTEILLRQPAYLAGMRFDLGQLAARVTELRTMLLTPVPADAFLLLESTSRGAIWFLVIIVLVYLFLSEWQRIRNWLLDLAPASAREEVNELYARVRGVWMAYLRGQLLLMLIVGIVFALAWAIIGIPGALVLGVLAGLFTLIPDVGPALAVILAMGVALLEGSKWIPLSNIWVTVIVFVTYLVLINFKNLWLRPTIMGRMVNMNEGVIFVAILTATMLSGILGALLVVPVVASGLILANYLIRKVLGQAPFETSAVEPANSCPEAKRLLPIRHPKKVNRN
jgi:predicted PurR-regulated permease PerM